MKSTDISSQPQESSTLPEIFRLFGSLSLEDLCRWDWEYVVFLSALSAVTYFTTWYLFFRPFNLFRDFTELGFEQVMKGGQYKTNAAKRNAINEYRRKRKIGDLPPSYPNGWFAILESDELPVKTAKEVDALGLNLVAWRGESGKCYVADAYCPHLGAHLGVGGKVHSDCIECPFHSWSFDGCTGKLTNIPYADSVPEFAKLKMWTTVEMYGFIYLWFHAENEGPTWMPDIIPEVESQSWKYRGRSEFLVACHIQEIPENGPDVAHLNVVHTSPILTGTNPEESCIGWNFIKHVWSASWTPNVEPRQHEAILSVNHHISLFNKFPFFHIQVDVRQIGPGIVLMKFETIFGRGILIQNVTPLEPLLQRVTHRFYSAPTFIHPLGLLILHGEATQISRDIRIWNRKTFINRPILTKEDKLIKSFRRWYSQFYSENSPKFQPNQWGSSNKNLEF
ncbi:unnamed protein product [Orchesella dallaii]|uniref:cholesterol 7-desaturase n=1 Tax=Orchesella dallaii TaxID=48710 RepID=A0ABP1R742_9HEXA